MRRRWSSAFRLSGRGLLEMAEASHFPHWSGCLSLHFSPFIPVRHPMDVAMLAARSGPWPGSHLLFQIYLDLS